MATLPPPQPAPAPDQTEQTRVLLRFLREENDASRRSVREDAEATRGLLRHTVWVVAIPITVLIGLVGWFGFKSVGDLKDSLKNQGEAATQAEISRMQVEIRKRLDEEFRTPAIHETVRSTAAEYTKTEAQPLIKGEVAAQVKGSIVAERPAIAAAVTQQTHIAVKQMEPQIDSLVKDSVASSVQTQVEPVAKQFEIMKYDMGVQSLILRMNNDDAKAYDKLFVMANDPNTDSKTQQLVRDSLTDVVSGHDRNLRLGSAFTRAHTEDQSLLELLNPNPSMRMTAIDTLGHNSKLTTDRLVTMASTDDSLNVRCKAAQEFNDRVKQSFSCLLHNVIVAWWTANKGSFSAPAQSK